MRKLEIAGFIRGLLPGTLGILAIAAAILVQATAGFANDSTARFGAGGIEFTKSEDVRILEEILAISTEKIRVEYRFINESDKDIHTTVAFPLARYDPFLEYNSPTGEPRTIMATFRVIVNGRSVAHERVSKAFVGDRDVTDRLRKSGLSEAEILFEIPSGQDNSALIEKLDALRAEIGDWKIEQTAFWQQTFPAGKEVVVEHSYRPWVGRSNSAPYQKGFKYNNGAGVGHDDECIDDTTMQEIVNRIKAYVAEDPEMVFVFANEVEYILGTGRNWKGPIGQFTLRIEKDMSELISLCFPGKPTKISPTIYEFVQKDYVPQDKLVIYFYTVEPHGDDKP